MVLCGAVAAVMVTLDPELVREGTHIRDDIKVCDKPLAIMLSIPAPVAIRIVATDHACAIIGLIIAALGSLLNVSAMASNR